MTLSYILLTYFLSADIGLFVHVASFGINYGQVANNLPPPEKVLELLGTLKITKTRIYDTNPDILKAFANSNVEIIVTIENQILNQLNDPQQALQWVNTNIKPYLPDTKITGIQVGNEVFTEIDTTLIQYLVPAVINIHNALVQLGLESNIHVSTPSSLEVLEESYPPSAGFNGIEVRVSETGWPSKGDSDEIGASLENAEIYNKNLLRRQMKNEGTPLNPRMRLESYLFALFNENLKNGPTSERNYGLFEHDESMTYNVGLSSFAKSSNPSTSISLTSSATRTKVTIMK
ncbi:glucan endo-1,3-beta-glucosidase 11-like protein [Trifolium pratense]|uniref:glucan endo-1,3-beta-D-glucosidase n=1 Tax=Trifolium pratense TaxID=57577 RepID=A0A2K3L238_TRIPR|nr:glucan endo-1,3-beta-glucosidase 11-like protein [Trifolium pratense]